MSELPLSRRIDSVDDPFQRGICEAIYRSAEQRRRRWLALGLLWGKHVLRGLFFSWPLYLLGLAALGSDHPGAAWLLLLLVPAVWVSVTILRRGVREDQARLIEQRIFAAGYLKAVLRPDD